MRRDEIPKIKDMILETLGETCEKIILFGSYAYGTPRKESALEVSDRIRLFVSGDAALKAAFDMFRDFVSAETLAVETAWLERPGMTAVEADGETWKAAVEKA